jgi:hypothetical protein
MRVENLSFGEQREVWDRPDIVGKVVAIQGCITFLNAAGVLVWCTTSAATFEEAFQNLEQRSLPHLRLIGAL